MAITAAAVASAPVDITLTTNRWMNNPQPGDAVYLPGCFFLQLAAQEYYHNQPGLVASAVKADYVQVSLDLYAGKIDFSEFYSKTPSTLEEYLTEEFRASGYACDSPYWEVVQNSSAYRWRAKTQLRDYWGISTSPSTPLCPRPIHS